MHLVMHIVIEGPDLKEVNLNQAQKSEPLHSIIIIIVTISGGGGGNSSWGGGGGGGESQGVPIPV